MSSRRGKGFPVSSERTDPVKVGESMMVHSGMRYKCQPACTAMRTLHRVLNESHHFCSGMCALVNKAHTATRTIKLIHLNIN